MAPLSTKKQAEKIKSLQMTVSRKSSGLVHKEAYSEPCQTSKMERFAKMVKGF